MSDDPERLRLRLQHRQLLAELGTAALRIRDLEALLEAACRITAAGMGTQFCKVMEYIPARQKLLIRAGIGWREGVVGHVELDAGSGSPAGHALLSGEPVIANGLALDPRFEVPSLLVEHGIRRAMNVIIRGDGSIFGVLEADSRHAGQFEADDTVFMQGVADMIGVAIERKRRETDLENALQARELLFREADHRIKNGLQLVTSLLSLQRSRLTDPQAIAAIESAISRVSAVAEAHRALQQSADLRTVAFDQMLSDLCRHTARLRPDLEIVCSAEAPLEVDAERAIPLGLMVSELLTNAVIHAYPEGRTGRIVVDLRVEGEEIAVSVSDEGVGYDQEAGHAGGLGGVIVRSLARQAGADLAIGSTPSQGTKAILRLRLRVSDSS